MTGHSAEHSASRDGAQGICAGKTCLSRSGTLYWEPLDIKKRVATGCEAIRWTLEKVLRPSLQELPLQNVDYYYYITNNLSTSLNE